MIWGAEVYGWTPAQTRSCSLRDLLLLSEAKDAQRRLA